MKMITGNHRVPSFAMNEEKSYETNGCFFQVKFFVVNVSSSVWLGVRACVCVRVYER